MTKRYYACGFLFDKELKRVVLLVKGRPEWQKGLLNGVGGKVEDGETPLQAMNREFEEEAGMTMINWKQFGKLEEEDYEVNFFAAKHHYIYNVRTLTDEEIGIFEVKFLKQYKTIDNLQWLIPEAIEFLDKYE